jgi:hypothetical protein
MPAAHVYEDRPRKDHRGFECGLAAMEFWPKVDYENIKLRFI